MAQDENVEEDAGKKGFKVKFNAWWKDFKVFVWNKETREFCGRSFKSWGIILSYYIIFFLGLAGYFSACVAIFLKTLDPRVPALQGYNTMLKFNPGMSFTPRTPNDDMIISFNYQSNDTFANYISILDNEKNGLAANTTLEYCNDNKTATFDKACRFDVSTLGNACTKENNFGYSIGKPCVFLRINNVLGWQPLDDPSFTASCDGSKESKDCEFYNVPTDHKSSVAADHIPVSCEGETNGDKSNLVSAKFFPPSGFPMKYFPYYNQPGYVPPVVAVQLTVNPGKTAVSCKIWTRKIKHDIDDQQGSVHIKFDLSGPASNSSDVPVTTSSSIPVTTTTYTTGKSMLVSQTEINSSKTNEITTIFTSAPSTRSTAGKSMLVSQTEINSSKTNEITTIFTSAHSTLSTATKPTTSG